MGGKWIGLVAGAAVFSLLLLITTTTILTRPGRASVIPPTVITPMGRYEGKVKTLSNGSSIIRYAGIAFAQPPVGDLRFRPPEPIRRKSSDKVINAQNFKKSCWSITKKITSHYHDEDCLYLNVYVPNWGRDQIRQYSVVVWIHGGGFVAGSVFPEPSNFVARGDVIVVTVNYRLGVFGFLTTEDDVLSPNNGLWDQVMAMRWVKDNIEYFGGDPNSVTLFGESAGAMSVALHSLSPVSSNLFKRAIFQSGSASSLLRRNPFQIAEEFGQYVGCDKLFLTTTELSSCLRNLSVEAILNHSRSINIVGAEKQVDFIWMPNIDGHLIPDDPTTLLKNETYLASIKAFDKDYLFGVNNNDGSLVIDNFMNPLPATTVLNVNFFKNLTDSLLALTFDVPPSGLGNLREVVTSFYIGSLTTDRVRKETLMDLVADALFYGPELSMAIAMSGCYEVTSPVCEANLTTRNLECINASGRSFLYLLDFCPPLTDCNRLPCMTHGSPVGYAFPKNPFDDCVKQQMSDYFIDFLSTFAKSGHPGSVLETEWPVFERNSQSYLSFSPHPSVKQYLHPYRMNLWLSAIPNLLEEIVKQ